MKPPDLFDDAFCTDQRHGGLNSAIADDDLRDETIGRPHDVDALKNSEIVQLGDDGRGMHEL